MMARCEDYALYHAIISPCRKWQYEVANVKGCKARASLCKPDSKSRKLGFATHLDRRCLSERGVSGIEELSE